MKADIERNGWNERVGIYTQSYGGDSPDAANLLLPAVNFMNSQDERFQRMLEIVSQAACGSGRGVYRYRHAG